MPTRFRFAIALAAFLAPASATAQDVRHPGQSGKRTTVMPPDREIALARSAAPAAVSDSADIWVFTDSGYIRAVAGTNGAACYVSRSWPTSIEPHCFDAEGASTILRFHMREVELLHRDTPVAEVGRIIGADLAAGRLRMPRRPAMSYMMSAEQKLINDSGQAAGSWKPHVMIYFPYLERTDLYRGTPDVNAGMITGAGSASSSIMIVVPDFVKMKATP